MDNSSPGGAGVSRGTTIDSTVSVGAGGSGVSVWSGGSGVAVGVGGSGVLVGVGVGGTGVLVGEGGGVFVGVGGMSQVSVVWQLEHWPAGWSGGGWWQLRQFVSPVWSKVISHQFSVTWQLEHCPS